MNGFGDTKSSLLGFTNRLETLKLTEYADHEDSDRDATSSWYSEELMEELVLVPWEGCQLRGLSLGLDCAVEDIVALSKMHATTLKSLELCDVCVHRYHRELLEFIATLQLDRIYLEGLIVDMECIDGSNAIGSYAVFFIEGVEMQKGKAVAEEWQELADFLLHGKSELPRLLNTTQLVMASLTTRTGKAKMFGNQG